MAAVFVKFLQIYLQYFPITADIKLRDKFSPKILAAANGLNTMVQI